MDHCDCGCISSEDFKRIFSNPLRLLPPDELEKYSRKAMTTWGASEDFRHFLPRLFELLTAESKLTTDTEIVFSKLTYGEWTTWDPDEQNAVHRYFLDLWNLILSDEPRDEYTKIHEFLCAIGQAVEDIFPYLDIWENTGTLSSYKHFHWFIHYNSESLPAKLSNPFWETRHTQMQEVINWLLSPRLRKLLATSANTSTGRKKDAVIKVIRKLESYSKLPV
jgi:hypothetical protein